MNDLELLEEKISHLQRMVDDLSESLVRHTAEIDQLNRHVAMLMQREASREADGGGGIILTDERPPHY
ncbi:MAG: SlyX family protein [Pseudoprimorskyibacter sp.]|nr:SlyX family protein [Pseudoprimorskyibacter sp.]